MNKSEGAQDDRGAKLRAGKKSLAAGKSVGRTAEVAHYVADMVRGMQALVRRTGEKDLGYLNYLLGVVREEAAKLSSQSND